MVGLGLCKLLLIRAGISLYYSIDGYLRVIGKKEEGRMDWLLPVCLLFRSVSPPTDLCSGNCNRFQLITSLGPPRSSLIVSPQRYQHLLGSPQPIKRSASQSHGALSSKGTTLAKKHLLLINLCPCCTQPFLWVPKVPAASLQHLLLRSPSFSSGCFFSKFLGSDHLNLFPLFLEPWGWSLLLHPCAGVFFLPFQVFLPFFLPFFQGFLFAFSSLYLLSN